MLVARIGRETEQIIHDNVNRASHRVSRQVSIIQRLRRDSRDCRRRFNGLPIGAVFACAEYLRQSRHVARGQARTRALARQRHGYAHAR